MARVKYYNKDASAWEYADGFNQKIDTGMSDTSVSPVQNKAIKSYVDAGVALAKAYADIYGAVPVVKTELHRFSHSTGWGDATIISNEHIDTPYKNATILLLGIISGTNSGDEYQVRQGGSRVGFCQSRGAGAKPIWAELRTDQSGTATFQQAYQGANIDGAIWGETLYLALPALGAKPSK